MLPTKYTQSVAYTLAGTAMNVMALSWVPKMLMPAAHQGMRRPARKKSFVVLLRRVMTAPIATRAARYSARAA